MIEDQGAESSGIRLAPPGWRERIGALAGAIAEQEQRQAVLWIPAGLSLGIAAYFGLDYEPAWGSALFLLAAAGLACFLARNRAVRLLCLGLLCVTVGFAAALLRTDLVTGPVLERRLPPTLITATVDMVEQMGERHLRLLLRLHDVARLPAEQRPRRARITVRTGGDAIGPGDRIETLAVLWPPPAPSIPGDFDFGRQLFFQEVGALGIAVTPLKKLEGDPAASGGEGAFLRRIERLRMIISGRIRAALPQENGAIADALVTGYRAAISAETNEAMRNSGLYHMLSISGLHMSMVAAIVFFSLRALLAAIEPVALRFPIKKIAAFAAILGTFVYLLLSGQSVPAIRSWMMSALVLCAVMLDRQAISLRVLALAAALILLMQPDALLGVSFQMSFAAVVALVAGYEAIRRARRGRALHLGPLGGILTYIGAVMASSVIAELAITPAALYHFNHMPLLGLIANLAAMPVTGALIMPALVLGVCLIPVGLEHLPFVAAGLGIDIVRWVAFEVAAMGAAVIHVPAFSLASYGVISLGGLWLALWRSHLRWLGLALIAAGVALGAATRHPDILIAGEGDLVAVRDPDGGLWFSPGRESGFARDRWARMNGRSAARWTWAADDTTAPWLTCDGLGCLYRPRPDITVAIVRHADAFAEDCTMARIVISRQSIPRNCHGPELMIGGRERWRDGGQTIRFEDRNGYTRIIHRTVGSVRNTRPWGGG